MAEIRESPKPNIPPATPPNSTPSRSITQEFRAVAKSTKLWAGLMTAAGVMAVLATLFGGYEVFTTKAEAAGKKAAQEAMDQRLPQLGADVKTVTDKHEDLHEDFREHVMDEREARRRQERKVDLILRKQGIRNPAPTPPEDDE